MARQLPNSSAKNEKIFSFKSYYASENKYYIIMTKKQRLIFCITGAIFTIGFGALSHFFYEWSGFNRAVGVFFAANESVWEHLKLAILPTLIFFAVGMFFVDSKNLPFCLFVTLAVPMLVIPSVFYTYTALIQKSIIAVDILTYILSVSAAYALAYLILKIPPVKPWVNFLSLIGIGAIVVMYMTFTLNPPKCPLFLDETKNVYGLIK